MTTDESSYQGGKAYGQMKERQQTDMDEMNKEILESGDYDEYEDLEERLIAYKKQFMEFDVDYSGDIDFMELKMMMEKLGQAKTHLECKKMIKEVDTTEKGTIIYKDFLDMMLGKRNSVLRLILMFEDKTGLKEDGAKGPPPKRNLADLP